MNHLCQSGFDESYFQGLKTLFFTMIGLLILRRKPWTTPKAF